MHVYSGNAASDVNGVNPDLRFTTLQRPGQEGRKSLDAGAFTPWPAKICARLIWFLTTMGAR